MRFRAAALALLVFAVAPLTVHAQGRTGRATGVASGTGGSTVRTGSIGSTGRTAVARGTGSGTVRGRAAVPVDRIGRTTQNRGSTVIVRGTGQARGAIGTDRSIGGIRAGRATGVTGIGSVTSDGVILRGSAIGSDPRGFGRRDIFFDRHDRSFLSHRRPVFFSRSNFGFSGCSFVFGFGSRGLTCFQRFHSPAFFVPFFFFVPLHTVHVQSTSSYVVSGDGSYVPGVADPYCAVVSVVMPGNDGYWKTMRLPVDGALTRDELRRMLSERLRAGLAFAITDADGVRLDVPAGLQVQEVLVDACR
jgi:hypothetical protein